MSRISNIARDTIMPHSAVIGSNTGPRMVEYVKTGAATTVESNSISPWPDSIDNTRILPATKVNDGDNFPMFPAASFSAPEDAYFKVDNFYQNNVAAYSPFDFLANQQQAVTYSNSFGGGHVNTYTNGGGGSNFGCPSANPSQVVYTSTPRAIIRSPNGLLDYPPSSLESDLEALWMNAEVTKCTSRLRHFSLSSEQTNSSSDGNQSVASNEAQVIKKRKILGRNREYYEFFGSICIAIPKNFKPSYPPNRKLEAFNGAKTNPRKKQWKDIKMECAFCRNFADSDFYKTHWLKNSQNVITCPMLRAYTCPLCKNKGGANSHTIRYCPLKRQKLAEDFERSRIEYNNHSMKQGNIDSVALNGANLDGSSNRGGHYKSNGAIQRNF